MSFKAKLSRTMPYGITPHTFVFSDKIIKFPNTLTDTHYGWLGYSIDDLSKYTLIEVDKLHLDYKNGIKYKIELTNKQIVNIETSFSQTLFLKWTHKKTWWHEERLWIIRTAIVTILSVTTSIYFSYRVGYQDGLKKGAEAGIKQNSSTK
jgi:hypothetical protein